MMLRDSKQGLRQSVIEMSLSLRVDVVVIRVRTASGAVRGLRFVA